MSDDQAPQWLVRWLKNLLAVILIGGLLYWGYWLATASDRAEADMNRASCALANGSNASTCR